MNDQQYYPLVFLTIQDLLKNLMKKIRNLAAIWLIQEKLVLSDIQCILSKKILNLWIKERCVGIYFKSLDNFMKYVKRR